MTQAILVLEDGATFRGTALGTIGEIEGEVVFNTGMTGYQEVLTDPSYRGQIVAMTTPHIGNVGLNEEDHEADRPWLAGFVVREASPIVSNWRATISLDAFLKEHGLIAMTDCPTRALVRHIRSQGAMRAVLSSASDDVEALHRRALAAPSMAGADLVREVTCATSYGWEEQSAAAWYPRGFGEGGQRPYRIVAFDFGLKLNILRLLAAHGLQPIVVPANTSAEDVLALRPDGVFLSNGPGDPAALGYIVETLRKLLGRVPIFGICLGHQLLGLALGGTTYKLKFGHRGQNQPVKNLQTGLVEITTHNHGFAVAAEGLPAGVEITHINLNDGCVEGLRHVGLGLFSAQFHPEASAGPHDAVGMFQDFRALIAQRQGMQLDAPAESLAGGNE